MADHVAEVQAQLGEVAGELKGTFFRLAGLIACLPSTAQEDSAQDLDDELDRATAVRSKVPCSCLAYPETVRTSAGTRSWRIFSATSICAQELDVASCRRTKRLEVSQA